MRGGKAFLGQPCLPQAHTGRLPDQDRRQRGGLLVLLMRDWTCVGQAPGNAGASESFLDGCSQRNRMATVACSRARNDQEHTLAAPRPLRGE